MELVGALKSPRALANIPETPSFAGNNLRRLVNVVGIFIAKREPFGIYIFGITGVSPQNSRQTALLMRCEFDNNTFQRIGIAGNGRQEQVDGFWTLEK